MVSAKEHGWILAIDQASNAAGVALFSHGEFVAAATLKSHSSKDAFGKRLAFQAEQLADFLHTRMGKAEIKVLLFEGVRSRIVLCTVGAFCAVPQLQNCRLHPRHSFVESSSWKTFAKKHGAVANDKGEIKGIHALSMIGWDFDKHPISSDDEADAVLIYKAWCARA